MKKMISIVVSIIALTVTQLGHAEEVEVSKPTVVGTVVQQAQDRFETLIGVLSSPIVDINFTSKDVDCLAKNIYYEAGNESEEGKVAVAMVTINRVRDGRFGKSICSVVDQKTVRVKSIEHTETKMVQAGFFGNPEKRTTKTVTMQNVDVCQFSWRCMFVRKPKDQDDRWQASQEVAQRLLQGDYSQWQAKYSEALYFHATSIKPVWAKGKAYVARVGGHHFYADRNI
jgi:spore germination cell wall hydrolase CwlJ-like protein